MIIDQRSKSELNEGKKKIKKIFSDLFFGHTRLIGTSFMRYFLQAFSLVPMMINWFGAKCEMSVVFFPGSILIIITTLFYLRLDAHSSHSMIDNFFNLRMRINNIFFFVKLKWSEFIAIKIIIINYSNCPIKMHCFNEHKQSPFTRLLFNETILLQFVVDKYYINLNMPITHFSWVPHCWAIAFNSS